MITVFLILLNRRVRIHNFIVFEVLILSKPNRVSSNILVNLIIEVLIVFIINLIIIAVS